MDQKLFPFSTFLGQASMVKAISFGGKKAGGGGNNNNKRTVTEVLKRNLRNLKSSKVAATIELLRMRGRTGAEEQTGKVKQLN